jgi:hypothetical protein
VTQVRPQVTRLGMTQVSNSGKVPSSDSGMELGIALDKGSGKRPGKSSGKEIGKTKRARQGDFFALGSI